MSYALAFTADARYDFAALDVELKELALDELDIAATTITSPPNTTSVRDLVRENRGVRDYVFLHLAIDLPRNAILILGIHHHAGPTT